SGGILGCFPIAPIKPCSFAGPIPGMAADCFGEDGTPVRGQVGELVVTAPWPGMTQGFWKDPRRYEETYWSRWKDVWVHGDWAFVDGDGFWFIQGRSDDTLKIAGKRLGPAEVESVLVGHPAVAEAGVVGVPHQVKGEAIVCFVVLRPGQTPSELLRVMPAKGTRRANDGTAAPGGARPFCFMWQCELSGGRGGSATRAARRGSNEDHGERQRARGRGGHQRGRAAGAPGRHARVHGRRGEPRGHAQERLRGDAAQRGRQGGNRATDGWGVAP